MREGFVTSPKHVGFEAKKLFDKSAELIDVAIAYIQPSGGGPSEKHTHSHDHLFVVTQGRARIELGEETVVLQKDQSMLVKGTIPHCVWNDCDETTTMICITLK